MIAHSEHLVHQSIEPDEAPAEGVVIDRGSLKCSVCKLLGEPSVMHVIKPKMTDIAPQVVGQQGESEGGEQ